MKPSRSACVVQLADVVRERVEWLWQGRIPLGKLTVIDGDPGLGKSTLTLDLAARVSRGAPMPDGSSGVRGGVVLLTAEDGLADTVKPRLEAAGCDPSMVCAITGIRTASDPDEYASPITLPEDIRYMHEEIIASRAKLVIIDPIMAFLGQGANSWKDQDIRRTLAELAAVAAATGAAIVLVRHLTKAVGSSAIYRGGGSIGIIGAARSGLLVAGDPDDENKRILASVKNNLAPRPVSLTFEFETVGGSSRIKWLGESKRSADDLVQVVPGAAGPTTAAEAFLAELLADGPMPRKEILAEMANRGCNDRATERAAKKLGIVRNSQGFGAEKQATWSLAHIPPPPAITDTPECPECLAGIDGNDGNDGNDERAPVGRSVLAFPPPIASRPSVDEWLEPFAAKWQERCGGTIDAKRASTSLATVVEEVGSSDALERWANYLEATEPRFCSPARFAERHGAYGAGQEDESPRMLTTRAATMGRII